MEFRLFSHLKQKNIPLQTPDIQVLSSHSALLPHLHVPVSHVSDVIFEHLGFQPHMQVPTLQVSDNTSQSSSPEHSKTLRVSKMYTHIRPIYIYMYMHIYIPTFAFDRKSRILFPLSIIKYFPASTEVWTSITANF